MVKYSMILKRTTKEESHNFVETMNWEKKPHSSPLRASYGVSLLSSMGERYCEIPKVHCNTISAAEIRSPGRQMRPMNPTGDPRSYHGWSIWRPMNYLCFAKIFRKKSGQTTPHMHWYHIHGLAQDCNIYIANALEILQSCTKPSICLFV